MYFRLQHLHRPPETIRRSQKRDFSISAPQYGQVNFISSQSSFRYRQLEPHAPTKSFRLLRALMLARLIIRRRTVPLRRVEKLN